MIMPRICAPLSSIRAGFRNYESLFYCLIEPECLASCITLFKIQRIKGEISLLSILHPATCLQDVFRYICIIFFFLALNFPSMTVRLIMYQSIL